VRVPVSYFVLLLTYHNHIIASDISLDSSWVDIYSGLGNGLIWSCSTRSGLFIRGPKPRRGTGQGDIAVRPSFFHVETTRPYQRMIDIGSGKYQSVGGPAAPQGYNPPATYGATAPA